MHVQHYRAIGEVDGFMLVLIHDHFAVRQCLQQQFGSVSSVLCKLQLLSEVTFGGNPFCTTKQINLIHLLVHNITHSLRVM